MFGDPLGRITDDPRHSETENRYVLLGQSVRRRILAVMFTERRRAIRLISARGKLRPKSGGNMRKMKARKPPARQVGGDEILKEYDFSRARPNKYASRYAKGSIVITLDPDVAAVFPGARQANEALRAIAGLIRRHQPQRTASRRTA